MYDLETQALALDLLRDTFGVITNPETNLHLWQLCLEVADETIKQTEDEDAGL